MILIKPYKGTRRSFLLLLIPVLVFCIYAAQLKWTDFFPQEYGMGVIKKFFTAALEPALNYQDPDMPESAPPFSHKIGEALWKTLQYAVCAISLSLPIGLILGFLSSKSWWSLNTTSVASRLGLAIIHRISRTVTTVGRSIHEILWALIFITALGTSPMAVIVALSIPYSCSLAKVFSELLDEQPSYAKAYLQSLGGGSFASWLYGIFPIALTDIVSYTLYRFECAIRSAAILGFVGITTIGLHIETAFEDNHYNELWTLLYSLLALILIVERSSHYIRKSMTQYTSSKQLPDDISPESLHRVQPKRWLPKITAIIVIILTTISWSTGEPLFSELSWEQRLSNLDRFLTKEITPYPVQQSGNWSDAIPWAKQLFLEQGVKASLQTLYIGTAAMILAFLIGLITLPWSSRSLNEAKPYGIHVGNNRGLNLLHMLISLFLRALFILCRSMPEFLLAFLLLQMLGPTAWPLILGLAIHNYGIVGRLGGELADHSDLNHSKVQLAQGGNRLQGYLFSILPAYFNRMALYFFYRWETCIRDATVLGLLGISSLGFLIDEARARDNYDEWLFFILLSACIVIIGDFVSEIVRSKLRNTSIQS
ncbi:MAG: ABC transporter permease subunit [Akkermansiaceae bacterium]|nr:ABC transporter permease subunit [Akkermansiaceae bacterium]